MTIVAPGIPSAKPAFDKLGESSLLNPIALQINAKKGLTMLPIRTTYMKKSHNFLLIGEKGQVIININPIDISPIIPKIKARIPKIFPTYFSLY